VIRVIRAAKERGCLIWMTGGPHEASSQMTESFDRLGWKEPAEAHVMTSHSGRKIGVTAGRRAGASAEIMREWMLVLDVSTVETYWDREYVVDPLVLALFDFLPRRSE
jgi:hypothetical protein